MIDVGQPEENKGLIDSLTWDILDTFLAETPESKDILRFWKNKQRNKILEAISGIKVGQVNLAAEVIERTASSLRRAVAVEDPPQKTRDLALLSTGVVYGLEKKYQKQFCPSDKIYETELARYLFLKEFWDNSELESPQARDRVLMTRLVMLSEMYLPQRASLSDSGQKIPETVGSQR